MRNEFSKKDLDAFFVKTGLSLQKPVEVYLLGGGAMAYRNQKAATKDLDMVFLDKNSCSLFASCLGGLGFAHKKTSLLEPEYAEMEADGIWVDADGFRLDLFVLFVCNKLELSPSMVKRSSLLQDYGNLTVRLVSNEDLVLFKSITDRDRDLDDMAAVIRSSGVNWNLILSECKAQSGKRPWHGAVFNKFVELKEAHGIDAPILPELDALARIDLVKSGYDLRIAKGLTRKEALAELRKFGFSTKELEEI